MPFGRVAGPDARDVATLLADDVGLLMRVERDPGVEVGEHDDEPAVQGDVPEAAGLGQVVADPGLHVFAPARARENVRDQQREVQDRGGEDDRDDAAGVELHRYVGALAAVHSPAHHSLGERDRYPPLAHFDKDDGDQEDQRQQKQEGELGGPGRLQKGISL